MKFLSFLVFFSFVWICCITQDVCNDVPLISRDDWDSQYPLGGKRQPKPIEKIIFIHTTTAECADRKSCGIQMRKFQDHHVTSLGFDDIAYNFVIGSDGNVYEGRGWDRIGAHTKGHNTGSVGIAFVGEYSKKDPSTEMLKAARDLIVCGVVSGKVSIDHGLYGHRDGTCTISPGNHFYVTLRSFAQWHARGELTKSC